MSDVMDNELKALLRHHAIDRFNAAYADVLDQRRFAEWPELFVEQARYRVQARENAERGLLKGSGAWLETHGSRPMAQRSESLVSLSGCCALRRKPSNVKP